MNEGISEQRNGSYPRCLSVPLVPLDLGGPRAQGYLWAHKNSSAFLSSQIPGARTQWSAILAAPSEATHLEFQGTLGLLWEQRKKSQAEDPG